MTQPPTDQQLAEIEARLTAEHLTPGPWHTEKDGTDDDVTVVYVNRTSPKGVAYSSVLWQADWATDADAEFTAHAREDVEALVAEVHRLRAQLVTARADAIRDLADKADPQRPEISFFGDHGHEVGAWMRKQAEYVERAAASA